MKNYGFGINFMDPSPEEFCFFCGNSLIPTKVQIYYDSPDSKNVLIIDYACFQHMIALGIKALWEIAPLETTTQ